MLWEIEHDPHTDQGIKSLCAAGEAKIICPVESERILQPVADKEIICFTRGGWRGFLFLFYILDNSYLLLSILPQRARSARA